MFRYLLHHLRVSIVLLAQEMRAVCNVTQVVL